MGSSITTPAAMTEIIKEKAPAEESKAENLNSLAIAKLLKEDKPESAGSFDVLTASAFLAGSVLAVRSPKNMASVYSKEISPATVAQFGGIFEKIAPESLRREIAQGSPLFNKERAIEFRAGIDRLFPNLESRMVDSLNVTAKAQAEFNAAPGSELLRGRNLNALCAHSRFCKEAGEAVQTSMQTVARDLHFPAPRFEFAAGGANYGKYLPGENMVQVNFAQLKGERSVAAASYHELGHGEQIYVTARKIADDLKLGKTATGEEMQEFLRAWAVGTGRETRLSEPSYYGRHWASDATKYLSLTIEMRNGVRLSQVEELRAIKLLGAFSDRNPGFVADRTKSYLAANAESPVVAEHLKYMSKHHEIETHMLEGLFK